ncbi:hypothetical protein QMK19_20990 [Streptomyces sp. H10-C2]|uniref:hypothetical protein n=1 Tax=unclassified Streptomyces TaxID=2593676 RepID=UPI0024BBAA16|nr:MULTISPECIES: hypothetical protein [unclassified Streptomyces]MDJ0344444.1 hypothetical protein [Streptomyces sp. PH10-H1]MDJ0372080.1 hypothetical protein [Streptomyces sp. H10-C2]
MSHSLIPSPATVTVTVTVIGLGPMGQALATVLLRAGHPRRAQPHGEGSCTYP